MDDNKPLDDTNLPASDGQVIPAQVQGDQAQVTPAPVADEPLLGDTPEIPATEDVSEEVKPEEVESFEDEEEVGEETPADPVL